MLSTWLQVFVIRPIRKAMDKSLLNPDSISIPRWTIKRDTRSSGCLFCGSAIVCVTTDSRQMAFCSCRLVEYRLLPRPNQRKSNPASKH